MKLKTFGNILIILSLGLILFIYGPLFYQELGYFKNRLFKIENTLEFLEVSSPQTKVIEPVSKEFGLVIPKIGINSEVFADVDAFNPKEYRRILTQGVAHAKGSVLPGEKGYIFIFAHSAETPLNIVRYHAVFYLLGKLIPGDEIDLFYQDKRFQYEVVEKKIVSAEEALSYISEETNENFLVLQTCYPPGTTLKRMVIIASKKG